MMPRTRFGPDKGERLGRAIPSVSNLGKQVESWNSGCVTGVSWDSGQVLGKTLATIVKRGKKHLIN